MADVPPYEEVTHSAGIVVAEQKVSLREILSICHQVPVSVFTSVFAIKAGLDFNYKLLTFSLSMPSHELNTSSAFCFHLTCSTGIDRTDLKLISHTFTAQYS